MTLICFASQKGSPGATATALAVAASLKLKDGRRKVLLEADATGGTLAIRYRLPVEPGLLTLAAAVRGGLDSSEGLWRHAQELPGGLPVIVCPDGPEQVHAALSAGGAQLGRFLNGLRDVDVMCDVGRLAPDSPALPFVAEASAVLMVARPTAEQLQPAARRMLMLRPLVSNLGWVLVGQKPYGPADVEATYEFPVVGVMADDPRSVLSLERGTVSKRLRRQPFIRSATTLAETLSAWLSPLTAESAILPAPPAPSETEPEPETSGSEEPVPKSEEVAPELGESEFEPKELDPESQDPVSEGSVSEFADSAAPVEPSVLAVLPAPTVSSTPPDVDLTKLPPPTGDPDLSTPSPELEPPPEPDREDEKLDLDLVADLDVAADVDLAVDATPDAASWAPPVEEDKVDPVPALISAPMLPPPNVVVDGFLDQEHSDSDPETVPFPNDASRLEPPPPAPVGSRAVPGSEPESLEKLAEPTGLAWEDLESVLPPAAASAQPPQPKSEANNGASTVGIAPPVPPASLSLDAVPSNVTPSNVSPSNVSPSNVSPLNGSPPPPPPSMVLGKPDADSDPECDSDPDAGSWDGSEFSVTADLSQVFADPDFDAPEIVPERTEPPMPPMASVPPLPPPSTQLETDQNDDRPAPSPFPHEESGADWTDW